MSETETDVLQEYKQGCLSWFLRFVPEHQRLPFLAFFLGTECFKVEQPVLSNDMPSLPLDPLSEAVSAVQVAESKEEARKKQKAAQDLQIIEQRKKDDEDNNKFETYVKDLIEQFDLHISSEQVRIIFNSVFSHKFDDEWVFDMSDFKHLYENGYKKEISIGSSPEYRSFRLSYTLICGDRKHISIHIFASRHNEKSEINIYLQLKTSRKETPYNIGIQSYTFDPLIYSMNKSIEEVTIDDLKYAFDLFMLQIVEPRILWSHPEQF